MSSRPSFIASFTNLRIPALLLLALFAFVAPSAQASASGASTAIQASSTKAAKSPKCTIRGTNGHDRLVGTPGRDVICGLGGDDKLIGKGGKDRLVGGKGRDLALGGTGDDFLLGGPGKDRLYGQPQDDTLDGGPGDDYLNGGVGNNQLSDAVGQNRCLDGAADTVAGTCDNTAPQMVSISVTPSTVDTSEAPQQIKVTMRFTDDLTGVSKNRVNVSLRQPETGQTISGFPQLESGDGKDGVYTSTFKMARYSAQGHWVISAGAVDEAGNGIGYTGTQLVKLGAPAFIDQVGLGDNEKPKITSVSLDRDTVDSSTGDQVIRATIHVTDNLTGINNDLYSAFGVGFVAYEPNSDQFNYAELHRVSGTDTDGIYEAVMTFKRYAAKGDWQLRVGAMDRAGNQVLYSYSDMQRFGWTGYVHQLGVGDTTAPTITELSLTPASVNTTSGPQTISIRYRMVDNLAGSSYGFNGVPLYVNGVQSPFQIDVTRTSGNALDGVYQGSVELPQGATQGNWTANIAAFDDAGNGTFYDAAKFLAAGLNGSFHNGPWPFFEAGSAPGTES